MKQMISWNEETGELGVIGAFREDEVRGRMKDYVMERIMALYDASEEEAREVLEQGEDAWFDSGRMKAGIVFPGGEYTEYVQTAELPQADTIGVETCIGRLEAAVNNGPGQVGINVYLLTGREPLDVVDVVTASLWTDKVNRTSRREDRDDIRIMNFYDPHSEDYPDDGLHILKGSELADACGIEEEDPAAPEEQSPEFAGKDLIAYTDGSYNKETGCFGAGVVMFEKDGNSPVFYSEKGRAPEGENGWQVNGEIAAAKRAIAEAADAGAKSLEIRCDYEGVRKWADKEWSRNKTYTQEYAAYVEEMRKRLPIVFVHVKGHSGDKWNNVADDLAGKACGIR